MFLLKGPSLKRLLGIMLGTMMLATSLPAQAYTPSVLRVGFTPWENPQDLARLVSPMVELLSRATGMRVQPFVATDYAGVIKGMEAGKVDVAFLPPGGYVLAEKTAHAKVLLKSQYRGRSAYYSVIIALKDSRLETLQDLKNRTFAFVDPASTSGGIYPKLMMLNIGINPERDFKRVIYAGDHDAVVLSVLHGKVDAGATYANDPAGTDSEWARRLSPADRSRIRILAISKPIPNDTLTTREDLDPRIVAAIRKAFLDLSATPAGQAQMKAIYKVDSFVPASPEDYDSVREAFTKVGLTIK